VEQDWERRFEDERDRRYSELRSLDRETMNLATTQELYQVSSNLAQNELRTVLGAIRDAAR